MRNKKTEMYVYSEKCRLCNTVTEYAYGMQDTVKENDFNQHMVDKVEHPRCKKCEHCQKDTVHDVVAYGKEMV